MDFVKGLTKSDKPKPDSDQPSNVQAVTDAAQNTFNKGKAAGAGAGADALKAASGYAKLDQTQGVGKAVNQAEVYLRETSVAAAAAVPPPAPAKEAATGGGVGDHIQKAKDYVTPSKE